MNVQMIDFFSKFTHFESEKNLAIHIESFLLSTYFIRPMMAFSIPKNKGKIDLNKCRNVLNGVEHKKLYPHHFLQDIIASRDDLKEIPFLQIKIEDSYYYYVNLGKKRTQFYFAIFSAAEKIPEEVLKGISQFSFSHLKICEKFEELHKTQELIHVDDVTGLYNQRKLYKDLNFLVDKFQKEKDPFCILFIDIDYFKKVNDSYGHLVGTKLLEAVAKDLKGLLRDSDISYRYGGDEFVIILTNSNALSGKIVGERILKTIKEKDYCVDLRDEKKQIKLSVSIGVAEFPTDAVNAQEILSIADRMMYEAKESGRGVVFNTQDVFKSSLKKVVEEKKMAKG